MTDLKGFLLKLNHNLNLLREREAKYNGSAPLDLLNQIDDHRQAIALTEQAIAGDITEADWLESLQPLLISRSDWLGVNLAVQLVLEQHIGQAGAKMTSWVGAEAAKVAGQIAQASLTALRQTTKGEMLVAEFEQDPATYQKPIEKELAATLQANAALVAQLKVLLEQYHQALQAHRQQTGDVFNVPGQGAMVTKQGKGSQTIQGKGSQTIISSAIGGDVLGPGARKTGSRK